MLQHVEHHAGHARAAAAACREAADLLRARAARLPASIADADWVGGARDAALRRAELLAQELRHEAASLDASADALDLARARAVSLDRDRAAVLAEQRRRARQCTPTGPEVGHPSHGWRW